MLGWHPWLSIFGLRAETKVCIDDGICSCIDQLGRTQRFDCALAPDASQPATILQTRYLAFVAPWARSLLCCFQLGSTDAMFSRVQYTRTVPKHHCAMATILSVSKGETDFVTHHAGDCELWSSGVAGWWLAKGRDDHFAMCSLSVIIWFVVCVGVGLGLCWFGNLGHVASIIWPRNGWNTNSLGLFWRANCIRIDDSCSSSAWCNPWTLFFVNFILEVLGWDCTRQSFLRILVWGPWIATMNWPAFLQTWPSHGFQFTQNFTCCGIFFTPYKQVFNGVFVGSKIHYWIAANRMRGWSEWCQDTPGGSHQNKQFGEPSTCTNQVFGNGGTGRRYDVPMAAYAPN